MLTSFPPLLSEVREESREVREEGVAAGDYAAFVEIGNFAFSSPCLPALPLFVLLLTAPLLTLLWPWCSVFFLIVVACRLQNSLYD